MNQPTPLLHEYALLETGEYLCAEQATISIENGIAYIERPQFGNRIFKVESLRFLHQPGGTIQVRFPDSDHPRHRYTFQGDTPCSRLSTC